MQTQNDRAYIIDRSRRGKRKGRYTVGINGKRVAAFVAFLCVCVATVTILLCLYYPPSAIVIKAKSYYAVIAAETSVKTEADSLSETIKKAGGGGFVINDGTFRIAAALYPSSADADKVIAKQADSRFSFYKYVLKFPRIKPAKPDGEELTKELYALYEYPDGLIKKLCSLSLESDGGGISDAAALIELEKLTAEIKERVERTQTAEFSKLTNLYGKLDSIVEQSFDGSSLSAGLKYAALAVADAYCAFGRGFSS